MSSVFTDYAGDRDFLLGAAGDWTISSGGLPNGDNYAEGDGSIALSYAADGDAFRLTDGTAWTIELWFQNDTGSIGATHVILDHTKSTAAAVADINWRLAYDNLGAINMALINSSGGNYMQAVTGMLSGGIWYYVVIVKETGNVLRWYLRNDAGGADTEGSSTSTSGTVNNHSSSRLWIGTGYDGANDLSTNHRIAKVAIYNRILSAGERSDHFLAMVAT